MSFTSWLRSLKAASRPTPARRDRRRPRRTQPRGGKPRLEVLEDRTAPAVLTVNSAADTNAAVDASALTLRDAVLLVNSGGEPTALGQSSMPAAWQAQIDTSGGGFGTNDTIQFAAGLNGQTITLGGSELLLSNSVTINGPGAGQLALDGGHTATSAGSRVFEVGSTATVTLSGLTIRNGSASGGSGGGILVDGYPGNSGTLTVTNCTFSGNSAGAGGAIFSYGVLAITGNNFSQNAADAGGGIYSQVGSIALSSSNFSSKTD
jgi:predicted outer membrane repeat protein